MSGSVSSASAAEDRRSSERFPVAIPASIRSADQDFTAKLVNIVADGAMFETAVPMIAGERIVVRCGSILAEADVVWAEAVRAGVKFCRALSEAEVQEQVSRSAAIDERRRTLGQVIRREKRENEPRLPGKKPGIATRKMNLYQKPPKHARTSGVGALVSEDETSRQQMLRDALDHLQSALNLLDLASAPPHIGAHVDLAAHELAVHVPAAQVIPMDERASRH